MRFLMKRFLATLFLITVTLHAATGDARDLGPAKARPGSPIRAPLIVAHPDDEYEMAGTIYKITKELSGTVDQFLAELCQKCRDQDLEVVALDFEEEEQPKNLTRLRGFIKHYGIEYTVLVGGEPDQVNQKIPQLINLNSSPTTLFIGRDGLVKSIYVGFPSPASGHFNTELKQEGTSRVESLLAKNQQQGSR